MEYFIRAYKNYANFEGRDTRKQYWMFYLFYTIFYILCAVVDGVFYVNGLVGEDGILTILFSLVSFLPSIAIATRRLHDIGKSGWWQLILLIPLIGILVLIYFTSKEGMHEDNQYGPSPYKNEDENIL